MATAAFLLLVSSVGVGFGWQPMPDGSPRVEYLVRIEPEMLTALQAGSTIPIVSEVPEDVGPIGRVRIVIGTRHCLDRICPYPTERFDANRIWMLPARGLPANRPRESSRLNSQPPFPLPEDTRSQPRRLNHPARQPPRCQATPRVAVRSKRQSQRGKNKPRQPGPKQPRPFPRRHPNYNPD